MAGAETSATEVGDRVRMGDRAGGRGLKVRKLTLALYHVREDGKMADQLY
jgi:hypothetical protein